MNVSAPDRTQAPSFGTLDQIDIAHAASSVLQNGIPVFKIDAGSQELVRIELIFPGAGATSQPKASVAVGTNDMLDEGTRLHTSSELAEAIDFYGAFLQMEATMDFSSVCLFSLNKHLPDTLPLLEEIVKQASFPEHEFKTYIQNKKQKFLVDEAKVATIARKKFTQMLFGNDHPYGHYMLEQEFDLLNRDLFADFHQKAYTPEKCYMVLAGKMDPRLDGLLEKHFGAESWKAGSKTAGKPVPIGRQTTERKQYVERKDAVQSALRIGRMLFNKTHPDYMGMLVLNTVFGGYFGSRLMSNIREDKGYTYGIGSGLVSLQHGGYFFISTEVGVDVCAKAIQEIYFELKRLRTELISEEELSLVRNYMLGTFLRSADGPFALADKFKGIYDYGMDYDYYQRYIQTIKNISPEDLRVLANTYFREEDMMELVVGKM